MLMIVHSVVSYEVIRRIRVLLQLGKRVSWLAEVNTFVRAPDDTVL